MTPGFKVYTTPTSHKKHIMNALSWVFQHSVHSTGNTKNHMPITKLRQELINNKGERKMLDADKDDMDRLIDKLSLEKMSPREKLNTLACKLYSQDQHSSTMTDLDFIIDCLVGLFNKIEEAEDHSHNFTLA